MRDGSIESVLCTQVSENISGGRLVPKPGDSDVRS